MKPIQTYFLKIHRWLALPFGAIASLICFSGAILVFEKEITGIFSSGNERLPFFTFVFRLHRWLLGSCHGNGINWGKLIVGISTIMFVIVLILGISLWWPRARHNFRKSISIPDKGIIPVLNGMHVAGGMYVVLILLCMALTGLNWSFHWYRSAFCDFFGTQFSEIKHLVISLHTGSIGGLPTKIIWFIAAMIGGTLPITGYWLWWKRMIKKGTHPTHQ